MKEPKNIILILTIDPQIGASPANGSLAPLRSLLLLEGGTFGTLIWHLVNQKTWRMEMFDDLYFPLFPLLLMPFTDSDEKLLAARLTRDNDVLIFLFYFAFMFEEVASFTLFLCIFVCFIIFPDPDSLELNLLRGFRIQYNTNNFLRDNNI